MGNAKDQIEAQRSGFDLERRSHEVICSFRGTYANRGNGMNAVSFDEREETNMKTKKLLALLLAAVMLLGLLPVTAGAEGDVSLRTVPNDNAIDSTDIQAVTITKDGVEGCSPTELSTTVQGIAISKTYIITATALDEFSLINNTGTTIVKGSYAYYNGYSQRKAWQNGKNLVTEVDSGSFLTQAVISEANLDALGYTSYKKGCTAYFYVVIKGSNGNPNFAILIQCKYPSNKVNTSALETAIAAVPTSGYYAESDRYNGRSTSVLGFWSDMQSALNDAKSLLSHASTQTEVDDIASKLNLAITCLIPTDQLNATYLYETVEEDRQHNPTESLYSAASWTSYTEARTNAQNYLASLFDSTGTATEENIAANQAKANSYADALISAYQGLDLLIGGENAQIAYDSLLRLANRLFRPSLMEESDYTPESWAAFIAARDTALEFYNAHQKPADQLGKREAQAYVDAYRALWDACYEGLIPVKAGTVTICVEDVYAFTGETEASTGDLFGGTYQADIQAGGMKLGALLKSALGTNYENEMNARSIDYALGIFLNGTYLFNMDLNSADNTYVGSLNYEDVVIKPGDNILVSRMRVPFSSNMSGGATVERSAELVGDIRYLTITGANMAGMTIEANTGEAFSLNAQYMLSMVNGYTGGKAAQSGALAYISACYDSEAEALASSVASSTGVVTDANGDFSLTLYSAQGQNEGWYIMNLIDPGKKGGVVCGMSVPIHVVDPSDLSELREKLVAQLDEVYTAYGDDFYTAAQLTSIKNYYDTAKAVLEDATASSGDLNAAYETAYSGITAIQKDNADSLNLCLANVRAFLRYLPNAVDTQADKLYSIDKLALDQLFGADGWYTRMTQYQRGQFTGSESTLISLLLEKYESSNNGADLPQIPVFKLTLEVRDADTDEPVNLTISEYSFITYLDSMFYDESTKQIGGTTHTGSLAFEADGIYYNLPTDGYYQFLTMSGIADADLGAYEIVEEGYSFDSHYCMSTDGVTNLRNYYPFREDATITIYVRLADADAEALKAAKNDAMNQLKAAYQGYNRSDYSAENWSALSQAYQTGVNGINEASTAAAAQSPLNTAKDAMAAVQKQASTVGEAIPGWDTTDAYDAGKQVGTVSLTVENTTYPGGAFTGVFINKANYPIGENDTMMTVILRALTDEGFTFSGTGGSGFDISYLASISKDGSALGEFSGESGSGWMGSLNDFLVNEGFPNFSVANNSLSDGDIVKILYTQNMGIDLGGTWGNSNTTLKSLELSTGYLLPAFSSGEAGESYDFALVISSSNAELKLTPTAANKNYLVKTFLNEKVTFNDEGNSFYKRTEYIPVKPSDVVYVGVGEKAWPSMNSYGAEARAYKPTWYALHVISADRGADFVNELIAALPAAKNINTSNYKAVQNQIDAIDAVIAVLSASEQEKVNTATLNTVREIVDGYESVMALKAEIAALSASITEADREAVEAAKAHYDALTAAQKNLLTVAETNKLLKAVNTMAVLDALAAIDDAKDFASTEANTQAAVKTALEAWLNSADAAVVVDTFTAAEDGTAENLNGVDGSYSATVTVTIGSGAAAASGEKTVTGSIIPVVYAKSSDAGIQSIKVNGVPATGSDTAYSATLPYGSDMATASFEIVPADKATASVPETSDGGETWTFTVTAEDGTTQQTYTVTLSVNSVVVTVHECGVYTVTSDVTVTELSPAAVSGLLEAVSTDALELPQGTETVALWLSVTATAKDGEDITLRIEPIYAVDGAEGEAVPAAALIGQITVTLPIPGTEYSKVLAAGEYLDAEGAESGITFMITAAGEYTLIPDAHIADVAWHLNGGTSADVTDGQKTIYFRSDAGSDLPEAEKTGYAFKGWHSENSIDSVAYIAVSAQLPADLYAVWQSQNVNAAVTVSGVSAVKSGSVFTVTLPYGSAYPKAADISITPEDAAATYTKPMTGDDGASWSFTVTAEDGTRQEYTLQVVIAEQTVEDILTAAKQAIEGADWNTEQTTANSEETLKTFVEGKLAALDLGAAYTVNVTSVTPAVAGNAENTQGTAGSYSFTVTLTSGEDSATATGSGSISATAYVAPAQAADYVPALNAVLPYLRDEVTDPDVGSTYGEWAVFALNRGGAATEVWNNIYLSNLKTYVDECGGKLAEKNYTEYSRVILALTSMGVDASSFSTDKATYDLVKPLLDKQDNGDYWAEWQGNNGTCFALLAVDSHGYLNTAEGKALRAGLIASLKAHQQASGAWAIEGFGTPDLDVTAAAVYALAPYYLDEAKLSALGGSVSYAEVKSMVENALAYLSNAQNSSGGFGSVEADVWAIIALSSIGRDADTDPAFVKNGKSLLADMLSYQDETTGAFRHLLSGSVDQMATEQAAYGLVAYDRFKNGKNTLYDMSDVSFDSGEQSQAEKDKALAESVDALIDAIGEVTLESENAIAAARTAYDALTDAQKALVTKLSVLTAAEAKLQELKNESGSGTGNTGTGESDKKTIRVTMRLIGAELASKDVDLGETPAYLPNYVTWIPTTEYELDEGATVYDLWVLATGEAGIRSVGAEKNYVSTVYAPSGYALSEFTNGRRSGWMYTIDGRHPGYGLKEQALHDGDEVIWHYINDYSYECADWFSEGQWQALGDGTYYNQWLKAPDTYLGTGGGIGDSGSGSGGSGSGSESGSGSGSGSETTETAPKAEETTVTVTPEVTDGEAKAEVGTEAIAEALKNNGDAQVLTVKVETEDAESVEAALTADTVKAAAEAEVDLHIETENGTIKIDAETLKEAAESGKEVSVTVRTNEDGTTTFDVTAGGEAVDTAMKVELPAAEEGQVLVIVNEDGTEEIIKKSVVEGDTVYAEIPAGATVKVIENSKEFNDVSDNAWYAGAVDFASSHDLFRGVSEDEFAPQSPMTRAMLATVLFRLEDEPEGAVGMKFEDMEGNSWYTDAVAWASENGIVNGTGNGFDPNANISREQIATMLYRYVNYLGIDTGARGDVSKFKDGKEVSSWASDAMAWAVEVGLFKGDETGSLNPKADATRAEVATLMERLIGLLVK